MATTQGLRHCRGDRMELTAGPLRGWCRAPGVAPHPWQPVPRLHPFPKASKPNRLCIVPAAVAKVPHVCNVLAAQIMCPQAKQVDVDSGLGFVADLDQYKSMYQRSVQDPAAFWAGIAAEYHWDTPWEDNHMSYNFDVRAGRVEATWFKGGCTNLAFNCLDRHVADGHGDVACFVWEGNEPGQSYTMTYATVLEEANWLKSVGIKKGDAVAIYMPMLCELPIAMLACARIGAVHSVVFGGFSADSLASRVVDCKARVLLTCSAVMRGAKRIDLKAIADRAMATCSADGFQVEHCLVYDNSRAIPRADCPFTPGRDVWWQDAVPPLPQTCAVEWMDAEAPLFLLYTSGSTGKPKGVVHTTGGYMVYAGTTSKYAFGLQRGDMFWCTADCGWITGHSYLAYGPLLNGATALVFEGIPTYPTPARCWEVIQQHKVKQFYTAPTAIRSLMRFGDDPVSGCDLSSLRLLGTVGEPINPEAWRWYYEVVGGGKCPVVDTWWQTETGGHMILPLPGAWPEKPGSATLPFFGVQPVVLDEQGNELQGEAEGYLCIRAPWPSMMRTVYGDHERYQTTYFAPFKGYYFSGDACRRDADGYFWITGRVDDVINVSGHRIGTAEVESALVEHPACAEAAVVGVEHPIKGQGIYAYCTLMEGTPYTAALQKELVQQVREQIGAFAAPDVIHWAPALPKTRSGKIMRRVLRKIATREVRWWWQACAAYTTWVQEHELGDTSTLADPSVVETLLTTRDESDLE